jgi:hypothetical protein
MKQAASEESRTTGIALNYGTLSVCFLQENVTLPLQR